MIRTAAFAIVGLLAIAAAPARADDGQTTTKTLRLTTTDLRSPAAQAELRHRVHLAARAVCGPVEAFTSPDYASYARCMTSAEQNALRHIDALVARAGANAQFAAR
jgi:UrcA family protein